MAIELLYSKVFPNIKLYIKKNSGNTEQAEDVFHDAIIKLILKVRKNELEPDTDLFAYLYTIARNSWIQQANRGTQIRYSDEVPDTASSDENIEELANVANEKTKAMELVMTSIGDKCKDLLMLTFYMKVSLREAAVKLGLSGEEVAKTNQYRCKKKMFELIKSNPTFRVLMNG